MKPLATSGSAAEGGFTLLEVLVAVAVLAFLVVGLTQGVRTGLNLWSAQTRRIVAVSELDATARVIRNMLTSIPIEAAGASGTVPAPIGFKGEPNRINLIGELPTGLGVTQRADITIELKLGRVVIAWIPHRHEASGMPAAAPTETELIRKVDNLEFAYWGATSPNAPATWLTEWDAPMLPGLIRVRVGLTKGDPRHWPDLIVAPLLSS
jgi:general secretion pathway protein J